MVQLTDIQVSTTFPMDIIRLFFEAAIDSGSQDDRLRQRTAYHCCLVSNEVKSWVEPLLYRKVVLESTAQVTNFLKALELKSDTFLGHVVKTAWFLASDIPEDSVDKFSLLLFQKCRSLKSLAVRGTECYLSLLRIIPEPTDGQYAFRELSILLPDRSFMRRFWLRNLKLQKIQLIHFDNLCEIFDQGLRTNPGLLDTLQTTPQIYFDSALCPPGIDVYGIQEEIIPLILLKPPRPNAELYIRYSSHIRDQRYDISLSRPLESLHSEEWRIGRRIFVRTEFHPELERTPESPEIERAKAWIGYGFDDRDEVSSYSQDA